MKTTAEDSPAPDTAAAAAGPAGAQQNSRRDRPSTFWHGKKWFLVILLALVVHLALIWIFGDKKQIQTRRVLNVPTLHLADDLDPFIALNDPTLFALPNKHDFIAAAWFEVPAVREPSFRWSEPPRWLAPDTENPQSTFARFAHAPGQARLPEEVKPPPPLNGGPDESGGEMPANSFLKVLGSLAGRGPLNGIDLPSLPYDNVIPPSRIQVLVDPAGQILSAVLLPSTDSTEAIERCDAADQRALEMARQFRFAPDGQLHVGEIDFCWHAEPMRLNHSPTGL